MPRRAFSLVEVAMVLLVLALVAGAVTLRVRPILLRMDMRACLDEAAEFDRMSRAIAREHGRPVLLVFDLAEGRVRRTGEDGRERLGEPLDLPPGRRLAEVRLAGRPVRSGCASVSISAAGLGPTYALAIEGRDGTDRRWLLMAGLTGQVVEAADGKEVDDAFAAIKARNDAR